MKIDPSLYIRPGTAAKYAGVSRGYVNRLCNEGRIPCFRVCDSWFVLRSAAVAYQSQQAKEKMLPGKSPKSDGRKIDPALFVTTSTAAGVGGVSRYHMSREARAGNVPGVMVDGQWLILRSAAEAYERHPSAGRPRVHALPRIVETANPPKQRKKSHRP
jgi:hypothetical protein